MVLKLSYFLDLDFFFKLYLAGFTEMSVEEFEFIIEKISKSQIKFSGGEFSTRVSVGKHILARGLKVAVGIS